MLLQRSTTLLVTCTYPSPSHSHTASSVEYPRRARMQRFQNRAAVQNHNGCDDPRHSASAQLHRATSTHHDGANGSRNSFQAFVQDPNAQSGTGGRGYNTPTTPITNQYQSGLTPPPQSENPGNPRTFVHFENASNFTVNMNSEFPNFVGDDYEHNFIAAAEGGSTLTPQYFRPSRSPRYTDFTTIHDDGSSTSPFSSRSNYHLNLNPETLYHDYRRNREPFQGRDGSSYTQPVPINPTHHSDSSTTCCHPRRVENDSEYPAQTRNMPLPLPTYEERISDVLVQSPPSYNEVWEQAW
ncbi:hypothetical protein BT96DRAFT_129592 [Gymnopus androsaceus JB14]|uniref:Uncharacterized protein n=1 Tax=Gymnopus androsaceus JB14 TaxID=1447944 RepID=A0A6A4IFC4_9AGAR|nr:hypothetical protein BT96DRAFT_129592 [Gymnopus androsaceus JB14]